VAVEKVRFLQKPMKIGDRKCPGDPQKLFIGQPGAILFLAISEGRLFQQPLAKSLTVSEAQGEAPKGEVMVRVLMSGVRWLSQTQT
jgi:hypothetical protein